MRPFGDDSPWLARPSVAQSRDIIPRSVLDARQLVSVGLACKVTREGRLEACAVSDRDRQQPELAAAALKASRPVRMKTRMLDGQEATGWTASLTLVFDVGGPPDRTDFRIWPGTLRLTDARGDPPRYRGRAAPRR